MPASTEGSNEDVPAWAFNTLFTIRMQVLIILLWGQPVLKPLWPHLGVLAALGRQLELRGQANAHPSNTSAGKVLHGARTKRCQEELDSLNVHKKIIL